MPSQKSGDSIPLRRFQSSAAFLMEDFAPSRKPSSGRAGFFNGKCAATDNGRSFRRGWSLRVQLPESEQY
jgi:hypothetical protein